MSMSPTPSSPATSRASSMPRSTALREPSAPPNSARSRPMTSSSFNTSNRHDSTLNFLLYLPREISQPEPARAVAGDPPGTGGLFVSHGKRRTLDIYHDVGKLR